MEYTEKRQDGVLVYDGKVVKLEVDEVLLPNGGTSKREIVRHSGGACVVYEEDGKIAFVRQYRYAYGESVIELPAGKLNQGEDPMQTAKRELEEETGVIAEHLTLLHQVYPTPGYTDERLYIYLAKDGKKGKKNLDEDEFLDVVWIPVAQAKEMLKTGEIKDAKTLVGLYRYFLDKK